MRGQLTIADMDSLKAAIGPRVAESPSPPLSRPWDDFFKSPPAHDFPDREQPGPQNRRYP